MADEQELEQDNENIVDDAEDDTEDQVTVSDMVDKILDGENIEAQRDFEALISSKLQDALEKKKLEIAQNIYNDDDGSEEELDDGEESETEELETEE